MIGKKNILYYWRGEDFEDTSPSNLRTLLLNNNKNCSLILKTFQDEQTRV